MHAPVATAFDLKMMARCIELSRVAIGEKEYPFACVICDGDEIIAEATNRVKRDGDMTRHAEMLAMTLAQKKLGKRNLSRCTLFTNVEPCAMCSYCIRETRMKRVVYAIRSPLMGGYSKWKVLQDRELSRKLPIVFGRAPAVAAGVLVHEAEAVWRDWNPWAWRIIHARGYLGGVHIMHAPPRRDGLLRRLLAAFQG